MDFMSYLDSLPKEIIILFIGSLDNIKDIENLSNSSYIIKLLLQSDSVWKELFIYRYKQFYQFILQTKNVDGCSTWKSLYDFYLNYPSTTDMDVLSSARINDYILNIFYLYKLSLKYPKYYEQVRDVNLDHHGIGELRFKKGFNWGHIFVSMTDSEFYKGIYTQDNFDLISYDDYATRSLNIGVLDSFTFDRYVYLKNNISDITAAHLFKFFRSNTDMYEKLMKLYEEKYSTIDVSGLRMDPILPLFISDLIYKGKI